MPIKPCAALALRIDGRLDCRHADAHVQPPPPAPYRLRNAAGVGTGVAVGCGQCVPAPATPPGGVGVIATSSPGLADAGLIDSTVVHVEHSHHDNHQARQDDRGGTTKDAGQAGCLKFCSDESSTLAKGKFTQADLPNPVVVAVVVWPSKAPLPMETLRRSAERPASPGPPLLLRFLRLTI